MQQIALVAFSLVQGSERFFFALYLSVLQLKTLRMLLFRLVLPCCLSFMLVIGCGQQQSASPIVENVGDSLTDIGGNKYIVGDSLTDIDGNKYKTVEIGGQLWMAENLKTSHYRNGDEIPYARTDMAWTDETIGMRCAYEHREQFAREYGQLYNWYAVDDDRGLCPSGWHVPSDREWNMMEMALGLSSVDARQDGWRGIHGMSMKTDGWKGDNASGFSALPGGLRDDLSGNFYGEGLSGYWWSASPVGTADAWYRYLDSDIDNVYRSNFNTRVGFSVRCVRD